MKLKFMPVLCFTLISLKALTSFAAGDACSLLQTALPTQTNMSSSEIQTYRMRLESECDWKQKYDFFKQQINSLYQFDSESVAEYQAMRFIRRVDFETAKKFNVPVEVIYQVNASQYNLPNEQKSRLIWNNWILGMRQLPVERQNILNGQIFDMAKIRQVHVGFFNYDEAGDFAVQPHKGKFKSPQMEDKYWWDLKPEEVAEAKAIVQQVNAYFQSIGLLPHFSEPYLNKLLDIRTAVKRQTDPNKRNVIEYVDAIYGGQTRANPTHVQNILNFMNTMLQQGLRGQHMIWNNKLMTPAEVAYLVQKFFVSVHPFHDGNGRTSRFLQELVLTVLNMPHGSSGDLMDSDVLSTTDNYYRTAMEANQNLMNTLQNCLTEYRTLNGINPAVAQQGLLNYSCRILNNDSTYIR